MVLGGGQHPNELHQAKVVHPALIELAFATNVVEAQRERDEPIQKILHDLIAPLGEIGHRQVSCVMTILVAGVGLYVCWNWGPWYRLLWPVLGASAAAGLVALLSVEKALIRLVKSVGSDLERAGFEVETIGKNRFWVHDTSLEKLLRLSAAPLKQKLAADTEASFTR